MLKLLDCRRDRAVVLSPYVAGLSYEDEQQLNDLPGDSARPGVRNRTAAGLPIIVQVRSALL